MNGIPFITNFSTRSSYCLQSSRDQFSRLKIRTLSKIPELNDRILRILRITLSILHEKLLSR